MLDTKNETAGRLLHLLMVTNSSWSQTRGAFGPVGGTNWQPGWEPVARQSECLALPPPSPKRSFCPAFRRRDKTQRLRGVLKRRRRARAAYVLRARARLRAQLPRLTARGVAIVELLPLNRWRESAASRAQRVLHRMLLSSSSSFRAASKYESTRRRGASGARCQLQLEGSDGERDHYFRHFKTHFASRVALE